jgi:hypothetical protein
VNEVEGKMFQETEDSDITCSNGKREVYKKVKRYNIPGHAHELKFSCYRIQKFLVSDITYQWLIDYIKRVREKKTFFSCKPEYF